MSASIINLPTTPAAENRAAPNHLTPARKAVVTGFVSLVGAGSGDPDLITVKALKLLQSCDVVVYDRLVNKQLLSETKADCQKIYVGKQKCNHSMSQHDICLLLVELANAGKNVVRLKGGDPFIFGRGGEEVDVLNRYNVPCQVVPGITAATGCAAATQIPLTHRDYAHAVTFITGHRTQNGLDINWDLAIQPDHTVVFYMGLSNLAQITEGLISRGAPAAKPIAIIANGTWDKQEVLSGTLATIARQLEQNPLPSPALIVMGDVVKASAVINKTELLAELAL